MRGRGGILVVVCAGVAFAGVHVARTQEATSANLPDQFQTGEMIQTEKSKKKKARSASQTVSSAPKENASPASEQTAAAKELPTQIVTEEKKADPTPGIASAPQTQKLAPVSEHAPPEEESAAAAEPAEKKPRAKKRPRPAAQPEMASLAAPVPMSLSVAQSMAITAPLPGYTYEAKRRNLTGSGVCVVTVDPTTGTVTNAMMYQSTGNPLLDKLTIQTFKSWRFKPGTMSQVRVPISYE